jgi:hypothetical protein
MAFVSDINCMRKKSTLKLKEKCADLNLKNIENNLFIIIVLRLC